MQERRSFTDSAQSWTMLRSQVDLFLWLGTFPGWRAGLSLMARDVSKPQNIYLVSLPWAFAFPQRPIAILSHKVETHFSVLSPMLLFIMSVINLNSLQNNPLRTSTPSLRDAKCFSFNTTSSIKGCIKLRVGLVNKVLLESGNKKARLPQEPRVCEVKESPLLTLCILD